MYIIGVTSAWAGDARNFVSLGTIGIYDSYAEGYEVSILMELMEG